MLRVWNHLLVVMAFSLSLFGTFLTRSGIVSSIHSFTQSSIGPWFLGFICIVVFGSLALIFARLPLLRSKTRLESLVSREATFLYNNLLLVALTLTILWGVAYPILHEAVLGESRIVGPGYYNFFLRVFGLPLLLLMGIGPLVAWRRASLRSLGITFAWPAGFALARRARPARARRGLVDPGPDRVHVLGLRARLDRARVHPRARAPAGALRRARGRAPSRPSSPATGAATAATSSTPRSSCSRSGSPARAPTTPSTSAGSHRARRSPSATTASPTAALEERRRRTRPRSARCSTSSGTASSLGTVEAGKNAYTAERQVSNEVGIRSDLVTGEDLFVIAEQVNADGSVYLRAFVKPLVNLIWLAGFVFVLGALITLWPDAREQRRLALRYEGAEAPARP